VVIVARDIMRLEEGHAYIRDGALSPQTQRFHHISADLTDASECQRVIRETTAWNNGAPPDIVWCCHGSAHPTLLADTPTEQFRAQMDQNYFSSAYIAQAALQAWLPHKQPQQQQLSKPPMPNTPLPARHLIFTASFVALFPLAGYSPYSPSKAALRSLSDSLSMECELYAAAHPHEPRIRVHTLFPATILTEGYEAENRIKTDLTRKLEEADAGQTPAELARKAIAGLEAGQELVATDFLTGLVMTTVMGGSVRGGFRRGLGTWLVGCVAGIVMVVVRASMDRDVRRWGREHGPSGMRRAVE
jgi:3-dehydrosphinganine reductase